VTLFLPAKKKKTKKRHRLTPPHREKKARGQEVREREVREKEMRERGGVRASERERERARATEREREETGVVRQNAAKNCQRGGDRDFLSLSLSLPLSLTLSLTHTHTHTHTSGYGSIVPNKAYASMFLIKPPPHPVGGQGPGPGMSKK